MFNFLKEKKKKNVNNQEGKKKEKDFNLLLRLKTEITKQYFHD